MPTALGPKMCWNILSEMEFEGQDSAVAELLLGGQVSLNLDDMRQR